MKDKAAVIGWPKDSFDALRKAYPTAELQKPAKFFGQDSKVENIYLRILVHNHEHMGQLIAYARMNGIVPREGVANPIGYYPTTGIKYELQIVCG